MAANKVVMNTENGAETLIDLTEDTVTAETLAEGVTAHDASGTQITGTMPAGSGSVQTDWNQKDETEPDFLKNKPFGDMPTGGDTLTWDGNTEGGTNMGVKVSNVCPALDDLSNGGTATVLATGDSVEKYDYVFPSEECYIEDLSEFFGVPYFVLICMHVPVAFFVPEDVVGDGIVQAEKGVYFTKDNGPYVSSFTIHNYTGFPVTKKMEEKYLPGAVILYADESLTYLYNSSDTSKAENRVTLAELKELVLSGIPIQVLYSGFIYCMATNFVDAGDMGGFGMLSILMEGVSTTLYTAEYVPEG